MFRPLILAALAASLFATPVLAAPAQRITIAFGDLNLSDPAGRAALQDRIHQAAASVCGPVNYSLDVRGSEVIAAQDENRACIRRAVAGAEARIEAAGYALNGTPTTRLAGN